MGIRGPLPERGSIRSMRGDYETETPMGDPDAWTGAPEISIDLTTEAQSEFERLCSELRALGVLVRTDRSIIETYLQSWQLAHDASAAIRANGHFVETRKGDGEIVTRKHPSVEIFFRATAQIMALLDKMGLSHAARARLGIPQPQPFDPDTDKLDRLERGEELEAHRILNELKCKN